MSIVGCRFERNHNDGIGSSIYVNIQNDVTMDDCTFTENVAANDGSVYIDPDVEGNTKTSTIIIPNCRFNKNQARDFSAIYISPSAIKAVKITSYTFEEEKGGIYLENIKNVIEINDNHFHNIKENMALFIQKALQKMKFQLIFVHLF